METIFNNKKGSVYFSVIIAVMLFMIGMIVVNFVKDEVTNARIGLNCASPASITDGTKLLCLITDGAVPYFIMLVLSLAGGVILDKVLI